MSLIEGDLPTTAQAVARYEAIQSRLPEARFPEHSIHRAHLGELVSDIDCFVLDGFGVLNVGNDTVPGAVERVKQLQQAGVSLRVLTNGASFPSTRTLAKYRRWGMDFADGEVVSSRDALVREMQKHADMRWGFVALEESQLDLITPQAVLLEDDPSVYANCGGFVILGTRDWNVNRHGLLQAALARNERPVLVGNPDLVAPWSGGMSREPGLYAHALKDAGVVTPRFFGKPFDNAFALVRESLEGIDPQRIAMVGDTLHTDILGGAQAGWKTVLVTGHGLLRDLDVEAAIERSRIRPDYIVPTT